MDEQLWAAFQSVYEPGSRTAFHPDERPDLVDALRAVAAFGSDMAEEELVRRDQFSSRTLDVLDDLRGRIASGDHVTGLLAPDPESVDSGTQDHMNGGE